MDYTALASGGVSALTSWLGARSQKKALNKVLEYQREADRENRTAERDLLNLQGSLALPEVQRGERGRAYLDGIYYGQGRYGPALANSGSAALSAWLAARQPKASPAAAPAQMAWAAAGSGGGVSAGRRIRIDPEAMA